MSDSIAGKFLGAVGDFAAEMGKTIGGKVGMGLIGAAAIAKGAQALIDAGESCDDILKRYRAPREVLFKWEKSKVNPTSVTSAETPKSKKGE